MGLRHHGAHDLHDHRVGNMGMEAGHVGLDTRKVEKTCRCIGDQTVHHLRRANLEPSEPQLRNVWAFTGQTLDFLRENESAGLRQLLSLLQP